MLNDELKILRKQHEQLVDIHTRCRSQEHSSIATQTDQVAKYCNCCELQMILTIFMSCYISTGFSLYITPIMLQKLSSYNLYTDTWLKVET